MNEYTDGKEWVIDWSKNRRIQKNGWSMGKQTTRRKFSLSLDQDIGEHLDKLKEEKGIFLGRIINDTLRNHFQLGF